MDKLIKKNSQFVLQMKNNYKKFHLVFDLHKHNIIFKSCATLIGKKKL